MRIDVKGTIIPSEDAWIYEWFGIESTTPKAIQESIMKANGEQLDVYINSGGGDVFAGSEIYSELRNYNGQVKIHVVGIAASAASVIACAGESDISPTAMLMVHNVSSRANGDYHDMDKSSEVLQQANKAIAGAYVAKTGMSESEALALMDKETWLSANEAVEKGLIDKIAESKNLKLVASVANVLPQEVIEKMRNEMKRPHEDTGFLLAKTKLKLLNLKG